MTRSEDKPTWLIIMENGSIGEARTKALLLDRFWVLERSVDIEGADFIVQCRLNTHRLDSGQALLGLVQAKFLQDSETTIFVNPDYVFDENTQARDAFFLIAHTGVEDDQHMYFLDAREIINDFDRVSADSKTNALKYRLPGKMLLSDKYKLPRSQILARIEGALAAADRAKNTTFFSPYIPGLQAELKPLELNQENFPCHANVDRSNHDLLTNALNELKQGTPKLIKQINYLLLLARTLKETLDPIEAAYAASELKFETDSLLGDNFFKHHYLARDADLDLIREVYSLAFFNRYHTQQKWTTWMQAKEKFITTLAELLTSCNAVGATAVNIKVTFLNDARIDSIVAEPILDCGRVGRTRAVLNHSERTISIVTQVSGTQYDAKASFEFASDKAQLFEEKFAQLDLWRPQYPSPDSWLGS